MRLPSAAIAICLPPLLLAGAGAALPAAGGPPAGTPSAPASAAASRSLARQPLARVYSAGQPAAGEWPALAAHGVTTVIDLRPDAERPDRDEAGEVRAAGLAYRRIPVAGPQDLTPQAARALWEAIEAAPGEVLVHCASGNRAGALLAIAAANEGGMAPDAALDLGRRAGMTSTEPRVRDVLGLPPAPERP